jgi:chaperonin GroEL (HSP60 family)
VTDVLKNIDTIGAEILIYALREPANTVVRNSGIEVFDADHRKDMGLDTRTGAVVNMFEAGITDPKDIVLNAVKNAISVAATVLTAPNVVLIPREDTPQPPLPTPVIR